MTKRYGLDIILIVFINKEFYMKKFTVLVALLTMLLCLVSCAHDDPPLTPPDDDTPSQPPLTVVENGATSYQVTRSDDSSDEIIELAKRLRIAIVEQYGLDNMAIGSDFVSPSRPDAAAPQYELLVGSTTRDESIAALEGIAYNDFIICISGTRVVIAGHNDAKTVEAVNYFIENYVSGSTLELPAELNYVSHSSYAGEGVTLMGRPLSDYTLVYKGSYKYMAEAMVKEIGIYTGIHMSMVTESRAEGVEHAIVIGSTKFGVGDTYATDSFSVTVGDDGRVLLGGRGEYPTGSACRYFLNVVKAASGNVEASALDYLYVRPDRSEYINDISKLAMHWDIMLDTPDWMLDYNEKYAAMNDADGRLMSCLHRGDMVYYPENSIEGIISAIRMGADMVEIDPRKTKDGVLVLMHDETLTRTTNFSDMAGKDGLPTSAKVGDWTYEQLCQLSLKEANGGANAALTEYKIPTLDEVMKVCAERIFVRLDKLEEWNYTTDIWPMIEKYKAYTTVIFTWHSRFRSSDYNLVKVYKKKMETAAGRSSFSFIATDITGSAANMLAIIRLNGLDNCIRLNCDFGDITPEAYIASGKALLDGLRGKARCYIDMHGGGAKYEDAKYYAMLDEAGINVLLCNKGLRMCQYIAEHYTATEY